MKNALVDPNAQVNALTSWELDLDTQTYVPVWTPIPDSARVAEIAAEQFPVAPPLFWVACNDTVVADQWYYDTQTAQILVVPAPVPKPVITEGQPVVNGAQTL